MKKLFLLILVSILGGLLNASPSFATEFPLQTNGHIQYYILQDSKTLVVQPPYILTLALTRAKSASVDFYGAYFSAKFDTQAISSDLESVKKIYPGYKVNLMAPSSFQSIKVDLGLSQPMDINIPLAGTDFFDGGIAELSIKEGDDFIKRNAEGHGPIVSIYVKTKKPILSVVAYTTVNMEETCHSLFEISGKKTLGKMLASVTKLPQFASITNDDLRGKIFNLLADKCVGFSIDGFNSISDFLAQSVTLQPGTGNEYLESTKIQFVDETKYWPANVKVVIQ